MQSLWQATSALPAFPQLKGDKTTDVLILGGGLCGILCSYFLKQNGVDHILIERDRICGGTTGNTTAKITSQHGLLYHTILQKFGAEKARLYLSANEEALTQYKQLCKSIPCDFEEKSSYVYSIGTPALLEQEMAALQTLGYPAKLVKDLPLPFPTDGAVCFPAQGQFHPLRFVAGIAAGLPIYEQTPALEIHDHTVKTPNGTITAKKIIVATHFPIFNSHGMYFMKLYQQRSYVIAYENAAQVDGMYVDASDSGYSLRNAGTLLLIGGNTHRTGKTSEGWRPVENFAKRYYPHAVERFRWAAQDCISLDGIPYIGTYSPATPDWYTATGFNKWGMTGSMVAAQLLTDAMLGRENPYAPLFQPSRTMLQPQLAANLWESTLHLLKPTAPRCPHMGCALKWNPQEHSWDCPCHGSRFGEDGKLLESPAKKKL